jgi:hypothetical protein
MRTNMGVMETSRRTSNTLRQRDAFAFLLVVALTNLCTVGRASSARHVEPVDGSPLRHLALTIESVPAQPDRTGRRNVRRPPGLCSPGSSPGCSARGNPLISCHRGRGAGRLSPRLTRTY